MMRRLVPAIAVLGLVACAPGAAYDNLTGGTKTATEDSALDAPRLISPVSVSMVATSRPHLVWRLAGAATGAIVELSKTRAFDGEIKQYPADGSELVVPEDLDAGIWFWRLTSKTSSTVGTKTSAVWEVLVRGPAAHGSSDAPTGAVVDFDGDGLPDAITVFDDATDAQGTNYAAVLLPLKGTADGQLQAKYEQAFNFASPSATPLPIALAAGTDIDGDGITDAVLGWYESSVPGNVGMGIPGNPQTLFGAGAWELGQVHLSTIGLREAGDTNADGYGDVIVSDAVSATVGLGGTSGPRAFDEMLHLYDPSGAAVVPGPTQAPMAVAAGLDANGDGFTDVALGMNYVGSGFPANNYEISIDTSHRVQTSGAGPSTAPSDSAQASPILFTVGGAALGEIAPLPIASTNSAAALPVALASGDFDGDGVSDLAASFMVGIARRVCVWYGRANATPRAGSCLIDSRGDLDLGTSLAAADLEGDGVDELLVTSNEDGGCVKVVRADQTLTVLSKVANVGPTVLTTIWPGRPGAARWAGLSADATVIRLFEGSREIQTITRPYPGVRGFGRALR